jgi:TPR repeat protein
MKKAVVIYLWLCLVPGLVAAASDDPDQRLFQAQYAMAQKGDVFAQYYLGEMYEHGLGTDQNLSEAFAWYEKSAAQRNRLAQMKLSKRKEIESEAAHARAAMEEAARAAAAPPPAPVKAAPATTALAKPAPDNSQWWKQQALEKEKAEAKEKEIARKRAAVRALILQKMQDSREAFE